MARAPFPGKKFKSYWPQHEIWAFQMLKEGMKIKRKKKEKKKRPFFIPGFLLFVVVATFILPQTNLLRLDAND